jgi:hypothetical protein
MVTLIKVTKTGLQKMQKLNYKALALTLVVSVNANANVFSDVGDWVSDNKGTTAMIGIGALATASVVVKPLKWLQDLVDAEGEEIASTEIMAGATGLQGNSLEAIASKLSVEEDMVLDGAVVGAPDLEYSKLSWTPTLDNIASTLRADGRTDAQIAHILERDTNLVTTKSGGLIEGVEKDKRYFTVTVENPSERIIDPSGLLKDTGGAIPKKGILKGAKDALKGVKNRIFKGVSDERL